VINILFDTVPDHTTHTALYTLHYTPCTLHTALHTLHYTPCTLHTVLHTALHTPLHMVIQFIYGYTT